VLTDHHKAVPYLEDLVKVSGLGGNCKGVRCIDWWVKDMIHDTDTVALDTIAISKKVLEDTRAETIVMGCTIVAGCYQRRLLRTGDTGGVSIVNPNLLALKMAEGLADLSRKGAYALSRIGFYEQPKGHYREQFLAERRKAAEALGLGRPSKAAE
jgi:allantoin racemase